VIGSNESNPNEQKSINQVVAKFMSVATLTPVARGRVKTIKLIQSEGKQ